MSVRYAFPPTEHGKSRLAVLQVVDRFSFAAVRYNVSSFVPRWIVVAELMRTIT